ncbi:MAG TPA: CDP-alcohol phosphatidyltransferase family protein [Chthoniobacterales bacterium]|jgi:CDP-L-myo-inositol myo-inositolphosphotransferase
MNLRRVLILADESADWMVAGLRQLDRIALSIHEVAVANGETSPVLVCIFWRPQLDQSQRWIPASPRLTHLAFSGGLDGQPYDLVLSTRLFLYRKAIGQLIESQRAPTAPPPSWESAQPVPPVRTGAWEYITDGNEIDRIEKEFLRNSDKSQDGFVSRYLNRPISRSITRLLLRFPATPNGWTWLISPIPVIAAFVLTRGSYWSFFWGLILFHIFSVLDGCDGEIARAKFMESDRGRRLDDFFDVLSNVFLVLGLGVGLSRQARFYWIEGILTATLIIVNEWYLASRTPAVLVESDRDSLGGTLYPRHRELVARSGLLAFGERFASLLIQLTKRDVAVLFFVLLALIGIPALVLHLLLAVTAITLALAVKGGSRAPSLDDKNGGKAASN